MSRTRRNTNSQPLQATTKASRILNAFYSPAVLFIILLASLIRLAGIFDDFWLDEIWSWRFARSARSARDIILNPDFHHDNNHWLNTLYLYALGDRESWYVYRLLSLATGIGIILLLWNIARRWGRMATISTLVFAGFSYIAVQYSSESRGYAPAAFFGILSFLLLSRFLQATRRVRLAGRGRTSLISGLRRFYQPASTASAKADPTGPPEVTAPLSNNIRVLLGLAYGPACILGFLSHASFLYAFLGGLAWAPVALFRKRRRPLKMIEDLLFLFLVPTLFLIWLYAKAIRGMIIGGGPHVTFPQLFEELSAFSLGLPSGFPWGWIGLGIFLASAVAGAIVLWRQGSDQWIFLIVAGVIAPTVMLSLRHEQLYPRYVFVSLPFIALLAAIAVSKLACLSRFGPVAVALILLSFLYGNMLDIWRFLAIGRGHYRAAFEYIASHSPGNEVSVGGDSALRTTYLRDFYESRIPTCGKKFDYAPDDSSNAPDWYLFTQRPDAPHVEQLMTEQWSAKYRIEAEFPHYGLSGWDWTLFHRVGAPETTQ